jgi:D-alanine-D-alanine ligase
MTAVPLNIMVLAGGISHEREVSLRSGRRVADALLAAGHNVTIVDPDARLFDRIVADKPDLVWPAVHGSSGEDGALLDLLEAAGVAFIGPQAAAARLTWSKPISKTLVERAGISAPRSITLPREAFRELGASTVLEVVVNALGADLVVKPAQGGSAQGVTIINSADALPRAMVDAYTYAEVALIEQRVHGVEVAVTIVDDENGPRALPAVEIVPTEGVYSFEARYNAGETTFFAPARLSDSAAAAVAEAAVVAHETLGLSYLSRIDFIIDESGQPVFLEANALPGLTETSSAPLAIEAAGLDIVRLFDAIARLGVARAKH